MLRNIVKNKPGTALVLKDGTEISYSELDDKSSLVASELLKLGANKNTVLPVFVDNNMDTIVFAIACWKVGSIFTPINSTLQVDVLKSIFNNLDCDYVFCVGDTFEVAESLGFTATSRIQDAGISLALRQQFVPKNIDCIKQLAVIIHTSGSTGIPKAACWSEASVVSFFDSYNDTMKYGRDSVGINNGPFYFDIVFQDTFVVLNYGGKVVLHDRRFIPSRFIKLLNENAVTHMAIMSSTLQTISSHGDDTRLTSMQKIMAGGEVGSKAVFEHYEQQGIAIYNGYGPTENNSLSGRYLFESSYVKTLIPIGVGFKNVEMIIVDDGRVVSESQRSGQILLGGNQLMEGYVCGLKIDREVFVEVAGKHYYPTGDFGYYDDGKNLVYEGRRDRRVKVNGNRFSLTTVYEALTSIDGVSYGYVGTATKDEVTFVVAALTMDTIESSEASFKRIRDILKSKLANYMLPRYLFLFESLPYKPSQKVDEKAIAEIIDTRVAKGAAVSTTSFVRI